ncbi:MAG: hypothetical protein V3V51_06285 [Desulfobacterales bacterium]
MKDFISQGLFLLSEIGVIVVMLIIIVREHRKRKESENKVKRQRIERRVPNQQTLYLD